MIWNLGFICFYLSTFQLGFVEKYLEQKLKERKFKGLKAKQPWKPFKQESVNGQTDVTKCIISLLCYVVDKNTVLSPIKAPLLIESPPNFEGRFL